MTLDLKSTDLNRSKFTEENVVKLKDRFPRCDDETLARYLIAQNNDVEGAATKLLKAEDLKTEYWHIRKSQCINEIKTGTAYLHGTDKEGRPLLVIHARLHDPDTRDLKEMIQMTLWWTEQALSKLPEDKSQFVILLDRDNCENAIDTEYLQKVAEIFQVSKLLYNLVGVRAQIVELSMLHFAPFGLRYNFCGKSYLALFPSLRICTRSVCTKLLCTPRGMCTTACGTSC